MRLPADENSHGVVVARLRSAGVDVEWIAETTPGWTDDAILRRADIASLVLVTNDRDFSDLIFNRVLPGPHAVLYTRLPHREANVTADLLIALIEVGVPTGAVTTITKHGNRSRPFPTGAEHG